ncbi:MAG TPA: hypothetical protein VM821_02905 [Abditibacteriaceae bacterium]|nr:hypothetical protein [Abditibacteriaceae bacterium]
MKGLDWKGIALGFVVSFLLAVLSGVVLGVFVAVVEMGQSASLDNFDKASEKVLDSPLYLGLSLPSDSLITSLGAYIAAGRSSSQKVALQNAIAFAILTLVLWLTFEIAVPQSYPLWYSVASYALVLPSAYFGAMMRVRRNLKTNRVLNSSAPPIAPIPLP